jgi:hypothetical protein
MVGRLSGLATFVAALSVAPLVHAEDSPFGPAERKPVSYDVDGWELRPLVEVRVRGEYHVFPMHDGMYEQSAVLSSDPISTSIDTVDDQLLVWERVRLGLGVKKGLVTAQVTLQDVRSIGTPMRGRRIAGQPDLPVTAPYEAWLDVATDDRTVYFRLGRQEIVIGDGRLVGRSDDFPTGTTLDAARIFGKVGDFDLQAFAAMLVPPGEKEGSSDFAPGAQLYGLDATWRVAPFFGAELTGLARLVREPLSSDLLTPSDVFVAAARVFGDYRGVRYSVTGAFEGGRVAERGVEDNRTLIAGAVAGRVEWETALPWRLTFGAQGAYASGGSAEDGDVVTRADGEQVSLGTSHQFDPILPDTTAHFGPAGFYAWTNVIEGGADVSAQPIEELLFRLSYRVLGSADAGKWFTASLFPVGETSGTSLLGHIAGFDFRARPWPWLDLGAAYWIMVNTDAAKDVFTSTRTFPVEAPDFSELAFLDARLLLP